MTDQATLIYDGECPFCRRYVRYLRLKKAVGTLRLVDARQESGEVSRARQLGLRLDQGMVLEINGTFYHGEDCLNRLALMSSRSGLFNRANYLLFRSPRLARLVYPVLRSGRTFVLRLLGRKPIGY